MRAITVRQPHAYLAGVLRGDAWISAGHSGSPNGYLCLRVADREFAETFAAAITQAYNVPASVRLDERGYWLCRKYNGQRRFSPLLDYRPRRRETKAAWLRGLFDSEGNANLTRLDRGPRSFSRRVAFYSTDELTLAIACGCLAALGFEANVRPLKPSAGHLGSKPVFELVLVSSREAYAQFANEIGSSIPRKQAVLDAIPESYCEDIPAARREAQAVGAATRRDRTVNQRYPELLAVIADRIRNGSPITHRALGQLDGYWAARKTLQLSHAQIVTEARKCVV